MTRPSSGLGADLSAATGVAVDPQSGQQAATLDAFNNFSNSSEIEIRVANTTDAAVAGVMILHGAGKSSKTLPNGVAITGTFASKADMEDYLGRVGLQVVGVRMFTNNTDNYAGKLTIGDRMPDGTEKYQDHNLVHSRVEAGNGGFNTALQLKREGQPVIFTIWEAFFMKLSNLAPQSYLSIFLDVRGIARTKRFSALQ